MFNARPNLFVDIFGNSYIKYTEKISIKSVYWMDYISEFLETDIYSSINKYIYIRYWSVSIPIHPNDSCSTIAHLYTIHKQPSFQKH